MSINPTAVPAAAPAAAPAAIPAAAPAVAPAAVPGPPGIPAPPAIVRPPPSDFGMMLMGWGVNRTTAETVILQGINSLQALVLAEEDFCKEALKHMHHYRPTPQPGDEPLFIPFQFLHNLETVQSGAKFLARAGLIPSCRFLRHLSCLSFVQEC